MLIPISTSSPIKERIVNENFKILEAWNRGIIDHTLSTPPETPSSSGLYIPVAMATEVWTGKENQLMWWNPDGYWRAISPNDGVKLLLQQEPAYYKFDQNNDTWVLERYQNQVYLEIADMAALNGITNMIAADHAEVLNSDGFGTPGWFIYGTSWQKIG